MSYSISTLLTRNLHDVFGENDSGLKRNIVKSIGNPRRKAVILLGTRVNEWFVGHKETDLEE